MAAVIFAEGGAHDSSIEVGISDAILGAQLKLLAASADVALKDIVAAGGDGIRENALWHLFQNVVCDPFPFDASCHTPCLFKIRRSARTLRG